jgi:hypothetical protein
MSSCWIVFWPRRNQTPFHWHNNSTRRFRIPNENRLPLTRTHIPRSTIFLLDQIQVQAQN